MNYVATDILTVAKKLENVDLFKLLQILNEDDEHTSFDFLGEGRRSQVFGYDNLAIKIAKNTNEPILFNDPEVLERLGGNHPSFLSLYGYVAEEIMIYERFEGKTLEQLGLTCLEELRFFPYYMLSEMKSGLDYCLSIGIIPADLHLGNIMVSPSNDKIKFIDVGDFYFCQPQYLKMISAKFKKENRCYNILSESLVH